MKTKLINLTQKTLLAKKVRYCNQFWSRLRGLLGTKQLGPEETCWIIPCNTIHTFGMRYPIDVYFLNRENKVIAIKKNLKPSRISPLYWKTYSVLEFKSGSPRSCKVGDRLTLEADPGK